MYICKFSLLTTSLHQHLNLVLCFYRVIEKTVLNQSACIFALVYMYSIAFKNSLLSRFLHYFLAHDCIQVTEKMPTCIQQLHLQCMHSEFLISESACRPIGLLRSWSLFYWLYLFLVYTTQVNSAFHACWLACSEVIMISQVLFTPEQLKKSKMVSRFK